MFGMALAFRLQTHALFPFFLLSPSPPSLGRKLELFPPSKFLGLGTLADVPWYLIKKERDTVSHQSTAFCLDIGTQTFPSKCP